MKLPQRAKFCVDPKQLALFATADASADADGDALDAERAERGICDQFVKLDVGRAGAPRRCATSCRHATAADEEAELDADAERRARSG